MTISRIWKEHSRRFGKNVGKTELFVVEPRHLDGKFLVKQRGKKGNKDEVYDKVDTLDEVWNLLQQGRAVRMKGQDSREWSTLNGQGTKHA
ncbi:hypothetical protein GCM10022280_19890 [Sphingomonas swuensis]|uniref:Uncharacterized protein n=1 Tax=Sphingomonas swuensis TaxID=977800 RepID=A0ABP7T3V0_9SPHN